MTNLGFSYREANRLDDALAVQEEALRLQKAKLGSDHTNTLSAMTNLGQTQLRLRKYVEAESLLREHLSVAKKTQPDSYETARARNLLGAALAGQHKYAEAEPLLRAGYDELKAREQTIPAGARTRLLTAALEWLVQFYEATSQPEEAAKWRAQRAAHGATPAPPEPGKK
jgi:hypothetical protein